MRASKGIIDLTAALLTACAVGAGGGATRSSTATREGEPPT